MSDFHYLVTSHFPRGIGNIHGVVLPNAEEAFWMAQIAKQIQRHPGTDFVGVDDCYNYTNVDVGSFLYIAGIVFEVDHIRGGRPCRIFMLKPLVGMTVTRVEVGLVGPHFPNNDEALVKMVSDPSQALTAVAFAADHNFSAALLTDGGIFSKIYYEDYAASELGDLFERIVALRKQGDEKYVSLAIFSK